MPSVQEVEVPPAAGAVHVEAGGETLTVRVPDLKATPFVVAVNVSG